MLSLLLAAPLALVLLIHPAAMLDGQGGYSHPQLMLVMWGISAGFVHGVGFVPQWWGWRWLFHPLIGWPLMGLGYLILWQAQL
jgi:cyd operon protein YbgE